MTDKINKLLEAIESAVDDYAFEQSKKDEPETPEKAAVWAHDISDNDKIFEAVDELTRQMIHDKYDELLRAHYEEKAAKEEKYRTEKSLMPGKI